MGIRVQLEYAIILYLLSGDCCKSIALIPTGLASVIIKEFKDGS